MRDETAKELRPSMSISTNSQGLYDACASDGSDAQIDAFETLWTDLYRIAFIMLRDRPGSEALAADCAQAALIKIHRNLAQCRNPSAFREWAAQVVRRVVLDELRRPEHARRASLPDDDDHSAVLAAPPAPAPGADLRTTLLAAIESGPLSDRSRRVVLGRYFQEQPDEALARAESELSGLPVLPSHIQVTRAKNLAKLRGDAALLERLRELLEP
jgi:RNA polymerase sigma factor (sigma-70 family)